MKTTKNDQLQAFKNLANQINALIRTGRWDELSETKRLGFTKSLINLYTRLKAFFSKESLYKILGAALFLISGNVSAQTFAPMVTSPFGIQNNGAYVHQPVFVDLDNDGDLDLFTVDEYSESFIFQENIGTVNEPNFDEGVLNPFGLLPAYYNYIPKLADFDGDGDFDILVTGYYGTTVYYENTGTPEEPAFGERIDNPFGIDDTYTFILDVVDIDGDGDLDIFTNAVDLYEYSTVINFYENTGTPTEAVYAEPVSGEFGLSPSPTYYFTFGDFADLDLDGDFDLIRVDFYGDIVYYHENTGTAEAPEFALGGGVASPFGITIGGETYTAGATFADIDGDGDQDLFIAEYYGDVFFYENLTYSLGINDVEQQIGLTLYPNPTVEVLNLKTELSADDIKQINVRSIYGEMVMTLTVYTNQIDVSQLAGGSYLLEIITNDQQVVHRQFTKN